MMARMKRPDFSASIAALKRQKQFRALIATHGAPDLTRYHGKLDIFESLLRSIIYQQLSGKAAAAIHARVRALYTDRPTPALVLKTPDVKLRSAGLSASKVRYVKDLARAFASPTFSERKIRRMPSAEIVELLTQIHGIGVWTVQMLLIFTLHRPDILPTDDLGIRKGFRKVYKLAELPTKKEMEALAAPWRDHATAASWYLWRSVDDR